MSSDYLIHVPLFMVEILTFDGDVVERTFGPLSQIRAGLVAEQYHGSSRVYPAIRRATEAERCGISNTKIRTASTPSPRHRSSPSTTPTGKSKSEGSDANT